MYDFMVILIGKIIAKWPWLYATHSEKFYPSKTPSYYSDKEKVEINGPIGRFMTREYNDGHGIYLKKTILYNSIAYTFPSLSLINLSSKSPHLDGFLQKFKNILPKFLYDHFYHYDMEIHFPSQRVWYSFDNEQQYIGKLLEKKIIKYTENLIKQLQLYINPLDYKLWERI